MPPSNLRSRRATSWADRVEVARSCIGRFLFCMSAASLRSRTVTSLMRTPYAARVPSTLGGLRPVIRAKSPPPVKGDGGNKSTSLYRILDKPVKSASPSTVRFAIATAFYPTGTVGLHACFPGAGPDFPSTAGSAHDFACC
jgi:hypothetical protein